MNELDFTIEFNSVDIGAQLEEELFLEADGRLRDLAAGHDDLRGAAVNIREPATGESSYQYEATVVVYARPENIAATEKEDNPTTALKGALSAVERQVRQKRDKLGKPWQRPGNDPIATEIDEIARSEDIE